MAASVRCPRCGLTQMASPTCKACGAALGGPAQPSGPPPDDARAPVAPSLPRNSSDKTRKQKIAGLVLVSIGTVLPFLPFLTRGVGSYFESPELLGWLVPAGVVLCGVGLACYADSKGLTIAWGLMALFFLIGPLLVLLGLSLVPPRPQTKSRPVLVRAFQAISLLAVPALLLVAIAFPSLWTARGAKASRAASDTKTAVTQAIVYATDKGVYPTSLRILRDSGYAYVPDADPWNVEYVLSPVLTRGDRPQQGDDVYIYSKGYCGTGSYEPTRWRKDSKGYFDSGKCGPVGYSSVHTTFIGKEP